VLCGVGCDFSIVYVTSNRHTSHHTHTSNHHTYPTVTHIQPSHTSNRHTHPTVRLYLHKLLQRSALKRVRDVGPSLVTQFCRCVTVAMRTSDGCIVVCDGCIVVCDGCIVVTLTLSMRKVVRVLFSGGVDSVLKSHPTPHNTHHNTTQHNTTHNTHNTTTQNTHHITSQHNTTQHNTTLNITHHRASSGEYSSALCVIGGGIGGSVKLRG